MGRLRGLAHTVAVSLAWWWPLARTTERQDLSIATVGGSQSWERTQPLPFGTHLPAPSVGMARPSRSSAEA